MTRRTLKELDRRSSLFSGDVDMYMTNPSELRAFRSEIDNVFSIDNLKTVYHSIYEKYVSVFSERSVGVLLFEDLQETPDLVYSKFSEYFSVSEDHISKLMSRSKKNATMRSKTGEFATTHKTLNDFVVDLARKLLSPVLSKSLLAIIRSVYSATFAKLLDIRISSSVKMLPSPSDSDIDIVYLMYCESNQAFFESVHLDKAKGIEYGYFL